MKLKKIFLFLGTSLILLQLYIFFKNPFYLPLHSKDMGKVEYVLYYIGALTGYNMFALLALIIIIIALKRK
jgi:hypothetical protein